MKDLCEGVGPPRLAGRDFDDDEIQDAMAERRLLRVNIEIGDNECPIECKYCYSNSGKPVRDTLTHKEIIGVMDEAVELGTRSIILTGGGEPLLDKHRYKDIISHARSKNQIPVIFTSGLTITRDIAKWLYDQQVTVITKLNSTKPSPTDDLSGKHGAHKRMMRAIKALMDAGYPGTDETKPMLGVESVITRRNYSQIKPLWRWIRERKLFPYIELTKLMGRARCETYIEENTISVGEAEKLFKEVAEIDERESGYHWFPIPPIMASQCTCYYCGCYVDMYGQVQPCSGVTTDELGNVRDPGGLSYIVEDSAAFHQRVRNIHDCLNGKCGECPLSALPVGCYGCRAHSFWDGADPQDPARDYFGGDPLCWVNPTMVGHITNQGG